MTRRPVSASSQTLPSRATLFISHQPVENMTKVADAVEGCNCDLITSVNGIAVTQPHAGLLRRSAILVGVSPIIYSTISNPSLLWAEKAPRPAETEARRFREDMIDHAGKGLLSILYNIHTLFL